VPHQQIATGSETLSIYRELVDVVPVGIVVLGSGPHRQVELRNAAAIAICDGDDGIVLTARTFRFQNPKSEKMFTEALLDLFSAPSRMQPEIMIETEKRRLSLKMLALRRRSSTPYVAIFLTPAPPPTHLDVVSLRARWALTKSEAELVVALMETGSIRASARKRAISEGTARQYLKRVYEKMDAKGQIELVLKLILSVR